jgi:hypothetical protein
MEDRSQACANIGYSWPKSQIVEPLREGYARVCNGF